MIAPPAAIREPRPLPRLGTRVAAEVFVLTLVFTFLGGALVTLLWTGDMRRRFDDRLDRIARLAWSRPDGVDRSSDDAPTGPARVALAELAGGPVVVVVRAADGTVLRSIPPSAPVPPRHAGGLAEPEFSTIPADDLRAVLGDGRVRLLAWPASGAGLVQVGMSVSDLEGREARVRLVFLLVVPVLAGAAAVGAWLIAGRRLGRLAEISHLAAEMNPAALYRRLAAAGEKDEIGRLAEEINRMLGRLEDGFSAKDRFMSEVSHELKTPVSVLLVEAQVLARSDPDPVVYATFVASVEDEMRRLAKLVECFLTLARARNGDSQMQRVGVDLNDVAVEAGRHCWNYAQMRGIRFSVTLLPENGRHAAPVVEGDPDLIRTLIENLLRNAIAVSPRQATIDLRVESTDRDMIVQVRDRGPGVPDLLAGRLFERFVTEDHSRQGNRGSGLGLAIAKGIAELHGGDVTFRNLPSEEGGGAVFSACLPGLAPLSGTPCSPAA